MRTYTIILEVDDHTDSDGEDIELWIEDTLREGLPNSLETRIISFEEDDESY